MAPFPVLQRCDKRTTPVPETDLSSPLGQRSSLELLFKAVLHPFAYSLSFKGVFVVKLASRFVYWMRQEAQFHPAARSPLTCLHSLPTTSTWKVGKMGFDKTSWISFWPLPVSSLCGLARLNHSFSILCFHWSKSSLVLFSFAVPHQSSFKSTALKNVTPSEPWNVKTNL